MMMGVSSNILVSILEIGFIGQLEPNRSPLLRSRFLDHDSVECCARYQYRLPACFSSPLALLRNYHYGYLGIFIGSAISNAVMGLPGFLWLHRRFFAQGVTPPL